MRNPFVPKEFRLEKGEDFEERKNVALRPLSRRERAGVRVKRTGCIDANLAARQSVRFTLTLPSPSGRGFQICKRSSASVSPAVRLDSLFP
jgi:hypothetical protein